MIKAPRKAGVMGWPVAHSRSPALHGFWLRKYGIDGSYERLPVQPEDLPKALRDLAAQGFAGVNLTVPHKEIAMGVVDSLSDVGRRVGAVNTIFVGTDGKLSATNTDAYGFITSLRAGAPAWRADAGPAVVLGAGGAARAVIAALQEARVPEIRILNRTLERAEGLAREFASHAVAWDKRADVLADANLLVNTTTLGMKGQVSLAIDLARLPAAAVVNDIVYVPLETDLLRDARTRGNVVVDGLGMLLYQAQAGFEGWFGRKPDVTQELRDHVLAAG